MSSTPDKAEAIVKTPGFQQLVKKRNKVRFALTALSMVFYCFFVGGITVYNQWFGEPISEHSKIPVGIVATIFVIIIMVFLEWLYVAYSQKYLDPMQAEVKKEFDNYE